MTVVLQMNNGEVKVIENVNSIFSTEKNYSECLGCNKRFTRKRSDYPCDYCKHSFYPFDENKFDCKFYNKHTDNYCDIFDKFEGIEIEVK